ncbi:MAG TPA: RidA family protein [Actinomycetes bacterium]|nr:RidA family protein [Actinomycetes bacterium]
MTLDRVNPPELFRPSGFSHAIVATGGRLVFLAGQTALDANGQMVGRGDVVAQFEQAMSNLLVALDGAGGSPEHLAKLTIYAINPDEYRKRTEQIGMVWRWLVGSNYPAMALIGVVRLWDPDALVELEGIAVLP